MPSGLRRAAVEDADAITTLVHDAYQHYEPLIGRTPLPMLTDYAVAVHEHAVWVIEEADGIVGVLELDVRDDHLWIENVAVAPGEQGRGLGRRLLLFAEDEARRQGRWEVGLLTNERYGANLAMYTRYGFRETHRQPHLGTDLVFFRKILSG
jgi:GNAT superfamily N-acetyltransferase